MTGLAFNEKDINVENNEQTMTVTEVVSNEEQGTLEVSEKEITFDNWTESFFSGSTGGDLRELGRHEPVGRLSYALSPDNKPPLIKLSKPEDGCICEDIFVKLVSEVPADFVETPKGVALVCADTGVQQAPSPAYLPAKPGTQMSYMLVQLPAAPMSIFIRGSAVSTPGGMFLMFGKRVTENQKRLGDSPLMLIRQASNVNGEKSMTFATVDDVEKASTHWERSDRQPRQKAEQ